jgi:hypothetical protein
VLADTLRQGILLAVFDRSHFKKSQLDSLLVKHYAKTNGLRIKEVVGMRDKLASEGSLERSASQAQKVISKSIATLILAISLGLVENSVGDSISRVALVLEQSKAQDLTSEEMNRLLGIMEAILEQASRK